jgi:hypothetical protein
MGFLALLNFSCQSPADSEKNQYEMRFLNIDSSLSDVNTYAIALIHKDSAFKKVKGFNTTHSNANEFTIFEGASLSKTLFAFLFWKMRKEYPELQHSLSVQMCDGGYKKIDPLMLLKHSLKSADTCLNNESPEAFQYSENNYILLQRLIEQISGKTLEELAQTYIFKPFGMTRSSFIWQSDFESNYVNGYYENNQLHRTIRKTTEAKSNGTLFTCLYDLKLFSKKLLQSDMLDSVLKHQVPVGQFKQLSWGNGMGIDRSTGHAVLWQWGCNWSYNHILIVDKENQLIFIALTNSMIGAKRLRETCNYLFNKELELFNYINWY